MTDWRLRPDNRSSKGVPHVAVQNIAGHRIHLGCRCRLFGAAEALLLPLVATLKVGLVPLFLLFRGLAVRKGQP